MSLPHYVCEGVRDRTMTTQTDVHVPVATLKGHPLYTCEQAPKAGNTLFAFPPQGVCPFCGKRLERDEVLKPKT